MQLLLGTEGGGIITAIAQWAPLLIAAGWDVRFVLLAPGRAEEMLRHAGITPHLFPMSGLRRYARLPRALSSMQPAIIHAHNPSSHLAASWAARRLRCSVVRTVHADMFEEMRGSLPSWKIRIWRSAMRYALRRSHALIVVSPHLIDLLPGIRAERDTVEVIANGLDPCAIEQDEQPLASEVADWLGAAPLVLSMGRLVPVKNYALLLSAWEQVVAAVPEARLILAGSGPQRDRLSAQCRTAGLEHSVRMLPWVDRIAPLLKRCSLVAISSRSECCPMLVFEAMSAARPVVSTAVGGVPHLVEDGLTGRLVRSEDSRALAAAIIELIESPQTGAAMGRAGRKRLHASFTHHTVAARTAQRYNQLLASRSSHP